MAARCRLRWIAIATALAAQTACSTADSTPASALLTGTVVDAATNLSVVSAVVAIESGSDADAGDGAYVFGAIAGPDGVFKLGLPPGPKTLHVFADGYHRALATIEIGVADLAHTFPVDATLANEAVPTLSNARFDVETAKVGSAVHLSVDVSAGASLARDVVVVLPDLAWSALLDPATDADGGAASTATYTTTFAAPPASGAYPYWLAAASIDGAASDAVTIVLPVE